MILFVGACLSLAVAGVLALLLYCRGLGAAAASPVGVASVFFWVVHVLMPTLQWQVGYFRYQASYRAADYVASMLLAGGAYAVFCLAALLLEGRTFALVGDIDRRDARRVLWGAVVVLLVGVASSASNLLAILGQGYREYMGDRIALGVGRGGAILLSHWTYMGCVLLVFLLAVSADRATRRRSAWVLALGVGYVAVYYGVTSNRNSLFLFAVMAALVWWHFQSRSRVYVRVLSRAGVRRVALTVAAFALVTAGLYGIGQMRFKVLSESGASGYGSVRALNGAFGNHENLVWLMAHEPRWVMGESYLAGVTNFVPRVLWADKPVGGGPRLKNLIYPGAYVVGAEDNSSVTTGHLSELMLNFGIMGVLIGAAVFGGGIALIVRRWGRVRRPLVRLLVVHSMVTWAGQGFYGEFLGTFARYVATLVPIVLLMLWLRLRGARLRPVYGGGDVMSGGML